MRAIEGESAGDTDPAVDLHRTGRGERALMTIETDEEVPSEALIELEEQPWVHWIRNVHRLNA